MFSRCFTFFSLSVLAALVVGCSSSKLLSSVEPVSKGQSSEDMVSDDLAVTGKRLPTTKLEDVNRFPFDEKRVPCNVVKVNVGPSLVCSEVETPRNFYEYKLGLDYGVEYQHLWRSGFGLGASAYLFNTSFDRDLNVEIKYVGPLVAYSDYLDSKGLVRAELEFGLGCGILKEKGFQYTHTEKDFAAMVGVGVEYGVAKNVAFGLQLNWNTLFQFEPKGYYIKDEDDVYGIERVSLLAGVREYF